MANNSDYLHKVRETILQNQAPIFHQLPPIIMMGYFAAKLVPANGSQNIMASSDTQNIARPQKNNQC